MSLEFWEPSKSCTCNCQWPKKLQISYCVVSTMIWDSKLIFSCFIQEDTFWGQEQFRQSLECYKFESSVWNNLDKVWDATNLNLVHEIREYSSYSWFFYLLLRKETHIVVLNKLWGKKCLYWGLLPWKELIWINRKKPLKIHWAWFTGKVKQSNKS